MGCSQLVYFLMAVWAVASVAHAQQLPEVSRQELENALSTEQGAQRIVQCLLKFQRGCDRRLMRIGEIVPTLLSNNFSCRPPMCTQQTSDNVRYFVTTMQSKYSSLWRTLITNAPI